MHVFLLDIDVIEEVVIHEITIALVVRGRKSDILVKVPALDEFVADLLSFYRLGHFIVHENRR